MGEAHGRAKVLMFQYNVLIIIITDSQITPLWPVGTSLGSCLSPDDMNVLDFDSLLYSLVLQNTYCY